MWIQVKTEAQVSVENQYKCRAPSVYVVAALQMFVDVFLIMCHIQKEILFLTEVDNLFYGFHLSQEEWEKKYQEGLEVRGMQNVCVMFDVRRINVEGCAGLELIITTEDSRQEMWLGL